MHKRLAYMRICKIARYYGLTQFRDVYREPTHDLEHLSSKDMQLSKKEAIDAVESYLLLHM